MGAAGQIAERAPDDPLRPHPRTFDLFGGLRAAASAVAMTVTRPSPEPETLHVCTLCGRAQPPNGSLVDLSTALVGRRHVRYVVALCGDCFEERPSAPILAS